MTGRVSSRWTSRGTGAQRKTVSPMFTPTHLDELAVLIRERAGKVLDALPRNETFNFVDRVSIELTTQMLATLVRFSLGRAPQADALVGRLDRAAEKHASSNRPSSAAPRWTNAPPISPGSGTSASTPSRATT